MAGSQAKKYLTDGHDLTDEFFNQRFLDIDLRLVAVENGLGQFDAATDALIQRGLLQINTQLGATIAALQAGVDGAEASVATIEAALTAVEAALAEIVSGAVPATLVPVVPTGNLTSDNAQAAFEELQSNVDNLQADVDALDLDALQAQINGLGDIQTVADLTAAAALTGLDKGDVIHVVDNGAGKWVRYQVTAAGDGTWSGVTRVVIFTQDQAPASHVHATADVTGLDAALAARALASRTISGAGLVSGGGDLSSNRTLTVNKATGAQLRAVTDDATALTPKSVADALAEQPLTDAATIAWDMATGFDFAVTLGGNRTLGLPTSIIVGKKGRLRVAQDGTGGRTLSFNSVFKFAGGTAPTLTTTASRADYLFYDVRSATEIVIGPMLDVR